MGFKVLIISAVWLFISATPMIPKLLLTSLEDQYDPLINIEASMDLDLEYHIVVLGAGYKRDNNRFPANSLLVSQTLIRLVEGVRLHHSLPNSMLITSGRDAFSRGVSQAEVSKNAATELGVDSESVLKLNETRTTEEEAKHYFETYYDGQEVIIVTDAAHMPRAMYEFRKFVDNPIPSPTNYTYRYKGMSFAEFSIIPSYANIGRMAKAIHEYAAITRNWFRDL